MNKNTMELITSKQRVKKVIRHRMQANSYNLYCPNTDERITINVRGYRFETYRATLENYPDTFLGSAEHRKDYFDNQKKELYLNRDIDVFQSVLFFYQSQGILAKPEWTSEKLFIEELKFYLLEDHFLIAPLEMSADLNMPKQETGGKYRRMIWQLLEEPYSSTLATVLAHLSIAVITLSVLTYCIETMPQILDHEDPDIKYRNQLIFFVFESIFVTFFTLEYLARIYASPERWKFVKSPMGVIDLCVIVPYFMTAPNFPKASAVVSLSFLRLVRLVRVLRVIKLTRYSKGMKILGRTLIESLRELRALFLSLLIAVTLSSSALYYFEGYGYPDSKFSSILDTFWFSIITMTTVGYGDMVPVTIYGKLSTILCLISGIIVLLCLPTPVFIAHFGRFYELFSKSSTDDYKEKSHSRTVLERV